MYPVISWGCTTNWMNSSQKQFKCRQWIRDIDMTFVYCLSITLWWFGPFPARPLMTGISQLAVSFLLVSSGLIDFASRSVKTPAYPRLVSQACYAHYQEKWWSDWYQTWHVRLSVDCSPFFLNSSPPSAACLRQWIGSAWFRYWHVVYSAQSRYRIQCWNIVNWNFGNNGGQLW